MRSFVAFLLLSVAPSVSHAAVIAGGVYDDPPALAVRVNFVPVAGATVKLFRDDGDAVPGPGDTAVATTRTDAQGLFTFAEVTAVPHWVVVDSRTLAPAAAWAEQTFGPGGSLCARPAGPAQATFFEGACFGGRSTASDDASTLTTAEHVALVRPDAETSRVDFAFSFNAVTRVDDGERLQGSLRQFVLNANAVAGPNRMRFVPLQPPGQEVNAIIGTPVRWWRAALAAPLPEITDAETALQGTAYNFLSPATVSDVNPGRLGEAPTVRETDEATPRLERPELELTLTGATGISCAAPCEIRALALHGAPVSVSARADLRIEHVLIGASADGGAVTEPRGSVGLEIERGNAFARQVLITAQDRAGILVGSEGRIVGEHLDVSRCGDPLTGGGIVLLSEGSSIRSSVIAANPGAGILLGSADGSAPARANTVDGSTISGNQAGVVIGPGSSGNVITRNDLMWNRFGGVTVAPFEGSLPPRQNRISANRFDENGLRPIVLDAGASPNELARGDESCRRNPAAANAGMPAPRITSVSIIRDGASARAVVRGRACPGDVVEIYQSYVTSNIREEAPDLPRIREEERSAQETLTAAERDPRLPSIGEFNYVGAAAAAADGSFEGSFPLPTSASMDRRSSGAGEPQVWAAEVLGGAESTARAFSAVGIDPEGNTSEMSVRRKAD